MWKEEGWGKRGTFRTDKQLPSPLLDKITAAALPDFEDHTKVLRSRWLQTRKLLEANHFSNSKVKWALHGVGISNYLS